MVTRSAKDLWTILNTVDRTACDIVKHGMESFGAFNLWTILDTIQTSSVDINLSLITRSAPN